MRFRRAAVLGAGTMGPGIAAVFASSGYPTTLWARRLAAAEAAAEDASGRSRLLVEHGLGGGPAAIEATADVGEAVADADIVVEAISEDPGAKRRLFADVEHHTSSICVLASTTSGLDIDELCRDATHPERFVVTHFWNPAHLIALVEVLGGARTAPGVVAGVCDLIALLGKRPVLLRRFVPGFLGVRLQQAVVREAIALLEAGVASAEDIDAATRLSFGARFPIIGPLETSDLGGLDVVASIHEYLLGDLDRSIRPQAALSTLVEAGHVGAKAGRGFYDWSERDAGELIRRRDQELLSRLLSLRAGGEIAFGD